MNLKPLVEVNNVAEMGAALDLGAKLVGVNNRNLHESTVDMGTTSRLADMVAGRGVVLCALSGIGSPAEVAQYTAQGIRAVLVGESLMRAPDTAVFIRTLLGWSAPPRPHPRTALVKICGVRSVADAHAAADAGAYMLGLMFVPSNKRRVDVGTAAEISLAMRTRRAKAAHSLAEDEDAAEPPDTPWLTQHASVLRRCSSACSRMRCCASCARAAQRGAAARRRAGRVSRAAARACAPRLPRRRGRRAHRRRHARATTSSCFSTRRARKGSVAGAGPRSTGNTPRTSCGRARARGAVRCHSSSRVG
jgi:hypothetical protein